MNTLTFFFFFVCILVLALLVINNVISINKPYAEKVSPYECGYSPVGDARGKFSIQFYLVAILFLIFDLEILLLFPFGVTLYQTSIYGFWVVIIFLVILTIGLVYELGKGALVFHSNPSNPGSKKTPPNPSNSKDKRATRSLPKRSYSTNAKDRSKPSFWDTINPITNWYDIDVNGHSPQFEQEQKGKAGIYIYRRIPWGGFAPPRDKQGLCWICFMF